MDVVSYKCPNCAAGLSFDIEGQDWHCPFCGGDFALEELEAPLESTAGEIPEEELHFQPPEETFDGSAAVFSCPSCGGRIVTDQNTAATFCVFCHNPTVLSARLEGEYRPARLLPFQLEKPVVLEALRSLCRRRPLLPPDFREYARKGEVTGLYVPFWLFSADMEASLKATGKRVATWSDGNYRYTKTDTFRVERDARMSFQDLPADGSKKMDDRLMQALEPFDYSKMQDFTMQYLSGHFAESYDVDADGAARQALPRMRSAADRMVRAQVTGYTTSIVHSLDCRPKNVSSTYVMLPVWTLMSEYKGKHYTFAMNGQTGKIVGELPICRKRFWTLFSAIAAGVALLVFAGGMLL